MGRDRPSLELTRHARARMQQRGVPPDLLDCLLDYGCEAHDHRGAVVVFFDKAARRRLENGVDNAPRLLPRLRELYAVVADNGAVITVGHRRRRLARRA